MRTRTMCGDHPVIFPDLVGLAAALARLQSDLVANDLTCLRPVRFRRGDSSAVRHPRLRLAERNTLRCSRASRFQTCDRKLAIGTEGSLARKVQRATCSHFLVDAPSACSHSTRAMRGRGAAPATPCAADSSVPILIGKLRNLGCFGAMIEIRHARIAPSAPGFPGSELGCPANAGVSGAR
jgi:hypothetical protein